MKQDETNEISPSRPLPSSDLVPVIDLKWAEAHPESLDGLDIACRNHGFFLLKNHGMDRQIDAMWQKSASFFRQPSEVKQRTMRTETQPLGYYDRELTKRKRDLKEVFDFREVKTAGRDLNQWPKHDTEFQPVMSSFFTAASEVAARTLQVVYQALYQNGDISGLPRGSAQTSNARLNFYPLHDPLDAKEKASVAELGDMALHHHTDPSILTLLLQDMTGGLQARTSQGHWIDIVPEENTIVVNLGDMMQVWTNDNYTAAVHRVLAPAERTAERFSTPFFYSPEKDARIAPLDALSDKPPVYRAFTWREYIQGRIDDNFTDLGEEDIQIAHYKVGKSGGAS